LPRRPTSTALPSYLNENLYRLTHLPANLFLRCVFLGTLNLVGVVLLGKSLGRGGMLEVDDKTLFVPFLLYGLMPVLRFYAVLFFVLPIGRLFVILVLNARRRTRNARRKLLASNS
jgi:hypothetical protein